MSFVAKIIAGMVAGDLISIWYAHRRLRTTRTPRGWRVALIAFFFVQITGLTLLLMSRVRNTDTDRVLTKPLLSAVYIWHFLGVPIFLLLAFGERVADGARRLTGMIISDDRMIAPGKESADGAMRRRDFVALAVTSAPALLSLAGTAIALPQLERFRIRRIELHLPALPPALEGLTIAHVTDFHVGRFTSGRLLGEIADATNRLEADLVLLTGDLINYDLRDLPAGLDIVRALRARHGVFMCEGNHDLIENPVRFRSAARKSGVPFLLNETLTLNIREVPVQILGLQWGHDKHYSIRAAQHGDAAIEASMRDLLPQRDPGAFPILLAHHPHAFDYAHDVPLTLAGHTHGGQLMLTENMGFGPAMFRYWSGVYRKQDRALVVSNGVGNWFPLRTRAPAEIIHLTLRKAPS
ncbi:MAG TPA: metallophosphoesterase [Chthoniobacteraceae bacterium]|nr:metallophosphoesterase [Chthoniobacteraceae bacterium]